MKSKMLVLDACCGSRMMWFDKNNPLTNYIDIRELETTLCDGRNLSVAPDDVVDFKNMPYDDESFKVVVFDPPHLVKVGDNSWLSLKYGKLNNQWKEELTKGFSECFRVLEENGILVFKWNEMQIKTSEIIKLTDYQPMFGHISGKRCDTHWVVFMKHEMMKVVK